MNKLEDGEIVSDAERQWKRLALAQEKLLACYRLGMQPPEKVLDTITNAKQLLCEIGEIAGANHD